MRLFNRKAFLLRGVYSSKPISAFFLFLFLSIIYFIPIAIPFKLAFPVAFLSLAAFMYCNKMIALAFLFSAFGDVAGSERNFLCQMTMFALAHICFIVFFTKQIRKELSIEKPKLLRTLIATVLLSLASVFCILSHVPHGFLLYATSLYMLLILSMLFLAAQQQNKLYLYGAVLFVCSDFILGVNKFTLPLPGYLIMITYYSAQGLIYLGALRSRR